jgi:hypothetical protein
MTASSACRSGASGVVRTLGTTSSPMRVRTVPSRPVRWPGGLQPGLDEERRRRLAVGARDADEQHPGGRVAVHPAGDGPEHGARVVRDERRHVRRHPGGAGGIGEHGDGTGRDRRGGEVGAVDPGAGSAAYRSPGSTARESRVQPVTDTAPAGSSSAARHDVQQLPEGSPDGVRGAQRSGAAHGRGVRGHDGEATGA